MAQDVLQLDQLPELLTVAEAARVFRCSVSSMYRLIASGDVPVAPVRIGSRLMFSRHQISRWLEAEG